LKKEKLDNLIFNLFQPPQGTLEELKQKNYWKKYIQWEKDNPLKSEDLSTIAKRGIFLISSLNQFLQT
jgi:hypothetical protein